MFDQTKKHFRQNRTKSAILQKHNSSTNKNGIDRLESSRRYSYGYRRQGFSFGSYISRKFKPTSKDIFIIGFAREIALALILFHTGLVVTQSILWPSACTVIFCLLRRRVWLVQASRTTLLLFLHQSWYRYLR